MQSALRSRLAIFDQSYFLAAMSYFPKEKGTVNDDVKQFLMAIFDTSDNTDLGIIMNAINLSKTWDSFGKTMPQSVLNKIFQLTLSNSKITPGLIMLTEKYWDSAWLFNSIFTNLARDPNLFIQSIRDSHPVWKYVIKKMDSDFQLKKSSIGVPNSKREVYYLFEAIIYAWPVEATSKIRVGDVAREFSKFCLDVNNFIAWKLFGYACMLYPTYVMDGSYKHIENSSPFALSILLQNQRDLLLSHVYDMENLSQKLLAYDREAARLIANETTSKELI